MGELKKSLGYVTIISVCVTSLIGTGMFFGPALASKVGGVGSLIAWALLGLTTIYVAMCFGELTSMFPRAGGVYEFSKHTYGRVTSFLIGWTTWIVNNITATLLIVAAINYLTPGLSVPYKLFICVCLLISMNIIAYRGIEESSAIVIFFTVVIFGVILALLIPGMAHMSSANLTPFAIGSPLLIFLALFFIVETYFGWEGATFLAEETQNPEKVIPRSLIISSIIVAVLGFLFALMMLGVLPQHQLTTANAPLTDVAAVIYGPSSALLVHIGVFLALLGSAVGGIISLPRLLLALSRDKLFLQQLEDIHPKYQTPYKAIIFQAVVSIAVLMIGFGSYEILLSLLIPIALLMYSAVILAVPILRVKLPAHPRPYKAPLGTVLPYAIVLLYLGTIATWLIIQPGSLHLFKIALSFIIIGIPIYLLLLFHYEPETIITFNNRLAYINLWMENVLLPKKVRKEIILLFRTVHNKVVLEFGTGVGTFTMHLAEEVGSKGKIYATELSERNVAILNERLRKKNIKHVQVIYDEHQVNRVHPDVKRVEIVFSIGMLSYLQDTRKVLFELNRLLPKNGEICFVEYVDFFWVMPNVGWLSSESKIKQVFKSAGFAVHVKKRRGLLWNYLIVYGIKTDEEVPYI